MAAFCWDFAACGKLQRIILISYQISNPEQLLNEAGNETDFCQQRRNPISFPSHSCRFAFLL